MPDVDAIAAARANPEVLILRSGIFDPAAQELDLSGIGAAAATGRSPYAIVQFQPGLLAERKALALRGVEFLGYVPNNAYYVRLTGLSLDALRSDPAVRSAVAVTPGMKLDPRLWASGDRAAARQADGSYEIRVHAFRGVSAAAIAEALRKLVPGVTITAKSERADAPQYVRASTALTGIDLLTRAASSIDGVAYIEPFIQPHFHNAGAIGAIQGNATGTCPGSGPVCGPTPIWDHGIFGSGQIAGIADSGTTPNAGWFTTLDKGSGPHQEITFAEVPFPVPPATGTLHNDAKILAYWVQPGSHEYDMGVFHGTHTTGTLVGDAAGAFGSDTFIASTPIAANHELADGMAPNAQLLFQDIGADASTSVTVLDFDGTIEQSYNGGAHIHNNSWGAGTAGQYGGDDQNLDRASHKLEDMLVVMSAGNDGPAGNTLGSPGNAKNALTVGALGHAGSTTVASFSSRGPTADGRTKPDIMAPGSSTISAKGATNVDGTPQPPQTASLSGTSMAAPTIAGNAVLMRQYFADGWYPRGQETAADAYNPSGDVMKAVLLNGTNALTNWPNNNTGWGRGWLDGNLWFKATMPNGDDSRRLRIFERTNSAGLKTGDANEYTLASVGAGVEFRATLTWFDPEAALSAASTLINNLDLEVVGPDSTVYLGNHFAGGVSTPGGTADDNNTVEQVRFTTPSAGSYTIRVKGTSVPGDGSPESDRQGYALAVSGAFGMPDPTPFPAPTALAVAGNGTAGVSIGFTAAGGAQGFQLYRATGTCAAANPGDFRLVASGAASPVVDDHTEGGFTYAYKVRGVQNDVEGDVSQCIEVVSQDDCTLSPTFDTASLVADANNASCSVDLSWAAAAPSCPDASGVTYDVLRDSDPYFGNPQKIANDIATPSFSDTSVVDGTPYYYQIIATDSLGNQAPVSRVLNVTPAGEDGPDPHTFFDDVDTHTYLSMEAPWRITNTEAADGTFSYHSANDNANYPDLTCAAITMPELTMPDGATMSIQAMYNLEFEWDGVVQEISTDGGATWNDLPPDGGYPSSFAQTDDPPVNACGYPATHGAFNGVTTATSNADPDNAGATAVFKPFTTDLASYAGQSVIIRWRFSSDPASNFAGFFLDSIHIDAPIPDAIFADGFDGQPTRPIGIDGGDHMCH
ncbi:MAG TPA: S8 family serine peptidase [Rhodanobacteraceae bacterium]|nr:S8 family serine peptidase [Rhodanobacteraceae bacterium]